MAPRRLSDSEKQDLVGRYKAGESTSALAEAFGCSPNTVSRTVKASLLPDDYATLKSSQATKGWPPPLVPPTGHLMPEVPTSEVVDASCEEDDSTPGLG